MIDQEGLDRLSFYQQEESMRGILIKIFLLVFSCSIVLTIAVPCVATEYTLRILRGQLEASQAYANTQAPIPVDIFYEEVHGSLTAGQLSQLVARPDLSSSFLIQFFGTYGDPLHPPEASSEWPYMLGGYKTPVLDIDVVDWDYEIRTPTLSLLYSVIVPELPPHFQDGDMLYVTACFVEAFDWINTPAGRCSFPHAIEVLRPSTPDLRITDFRIEINNTTCGFDISGRVTNNGNAFADDFRVNILQSRNMSWEDGDDRHLHQTEKLTLAPAQSLAFRHQLEGPIRYTGCNTERVRTCDPIRIRACATRGVPLDRMPYRDQMEVSMDDNCRTWSTRAPIWPSDIYNQCLAVADGPSRNSTESGVRPRFPDQLLQGLPPSVGDNMITLPQQLILVTQPKKNEELCLGEEQIIRWRTFGITDKGVAIESYIKKIPPVFYSINASAPNTGTYRWTPSSFLSPGTYQVRVKMLNRGDGAATTVHGDSREFRLKRCGSE